MSVAFLVNSASMHVHPQSVAAERGGGRERKRFIVKWRAYANAR